MRDRLPNHPKYAAVIEQVLTILHENGISISHEDYHGEFIIEPWSLDNAKWLRNASLRIPEPKPSAAERIKPLGESS